MLIRQEINVASDNIDVVATTSAAASSVVVSLLPRTLSSSWQRGGELATRNIEQQLAAWW